MAFLEYKGMNVISCILKEGGFVRILPGINEINDLHYNEIITNPSITGRIKKGMIVLMKSSSEDDQVTMIPKIFDKKLLNKLIKNDNRPEVIDAAKRQLALIEDKPKDSYVHEGQHFS